MYSFTSRFAHRILLPPVSSLFIIDCQEEEFFAVLGTVGELMVVVPDADEFVYRVMSMLLCSLA